VKLSERLEALLGRMTNGHVMALQCMEFIRDHGPALAELARRVEDAPCAVAGQSPGRFYYAGGSAPVEHGQRVRLVPEAGQEVGDG
jgi:4-hydroxyphenylpyruvate dioxygenase-like putative hemolysin